MPDNVPVSKILLMAGGALLFISSIFDWVDTGPFASRTELFGITWLFTLIIGGGIAVLVALETFGNISLPDEILGFSMNQIYLALGFAAFLITFGLQLGGEAREFGLVIGWISAAVVVAGAFMEQQSGKSTSGPTEF